MHRPKLPKLAVSKSGSLGRECRLRLCVRLTGMKVKETKKLFRLREVAHAARRPAACVTWGSGALAPVAAARRDGNFWNPTL